MPMNPGKAIAQQLGPGVGVEGLIFPLHLGAILSQLVQASQQLPHYQDVSHPFPSLWNKKENIGYCCGSEAALQMGAWA